jgi:hypothetical protein
MRTWWILLLLVNGSLISFAQADSSKKINPLGRLQKLAGKIGQSNALSNDQIVQGLKEALSIGAERGTQKLSATDGFFANAALKILLPEEAQKVERTLRSMGLGKQVDQAILSMNRAAEDAARSAAPIFVQAVKEMTLQDAVGILKGTDTAATAYLRGKTSAKITEAFRPVIEKSLEKVEATKYWNTVFSTYNKVAPTKVNPDLSAYVTDKALQGIFVQLGQEEAKIRKDPAARTTEILKTVFKQ